MPCIQVEQISKTYQAGLTTVRALQEVSLTVEYGEFLSIMGASGCGKSTLLNCIGSIDTVDKGTITIDNTVITKLKNIQLAQFRRDSLGFVFQDYSLLPQLTVFENIAYPLILEKISHQKLAKQVEEIANLLGISPLLQKAPQELSGGQQQKTAIARGLIKKPKILLADEPTGALDRTSTRNLMDTLKVINQELGTTILVISHDIYVATFTNRAVVMHDGCIVENLVLKGKDTKTIYSDITNIFLKLEEM